MTMDAPQPWVTAACKRLTKRQLIQVIDQLVSRTWDAPDRLERLVRDVERHRLRSESDAAWAQRQRLMAELDERWPHGWQGLDLAEVLAYRELWKRARAAADRSAALLDQLKRTYETGDTHGSH